MARRRAVGLVVQNNHPVVEHGEAVYLAVDPPPGDLADQRRLGARMGTEQLGPVGIDVDRQI
jgi:hypothetical protein